MKIKFIFAWYDFWVGCFWDSKKKYLYFFPVPMFGIILKFNRNDVTNISNSNIVSNTINNGNMNVGNNIVINKKGDS